MLRESVGPVQNLGVRRQTLRTTNAPSTPFGSSWDGEGVLGKRSVKRDAMYRWRNQESLDFSRKFDHIFDRLEDRRRIGKISLNVGFYDH